MLCKNRTLARFRSRIPALGASKNLTVATYPAAAVIFVAQAIRGFGGAAHRRGPGPVALSLPPQPSHVRGNPAPALVGSGLRARMHPESVSGTWQASAGRRVKHPNLV
jgi:hypothetical protein